MAAGAVVAAADGLGTADGATARVGAAGVVGAQAATITAIMDTKSQATEPGQRASFAFFKPFWTRIQSFTFLVRIFQLGHVAYHYPYRWRAANIPKDCPEGTPGINSAG